MKFSIVIPLYNKQDSIRRALQSVFDQVDYDATQYEVIVVDDGSNDNSLEIVNSIKREHGDRQITVYSQVNAGVSAARNRGLEIARSDYIAFLDADDTYEPNFLSEITGLINQFPSAAMFATAYRFVDTSAGTRRNAGIVGTQNSFEPQLLEDYFYSAANGDLPITSSSVCIRKNALEGVGGFPLGENMGEDQAVWSQIALKHPIAISPKVCANYFEATASSLMQVVAPSDEMPFSKRLQQQLDQGQVVNSQRSSLKKYIAGHLLDLVRRNLKAGDMSSARSLLDDRRTHKQFKRYLYWRAQFCVLRLTQAVRTLCTI